MSCAETIVSAAPEAAAEFRRELTLTLEAVLAAMKSDRAFSGMLPLELKEHLTVAELLPEHGLGFDAVLRSVSERILPNMLRPFSTSYLAHLHSPVLLESAAAELIITAFNQSMDSWDQSPAATWVEIETIRHLLRLFGFDATADGCFSSGGSQSNLTGILLARDWYCRTALNCDVRRDGLPERFRKLRLYTSEVSHFSMEKSAHLLGLGYDAVVKIPVDAAWKMDVAALERRMARDVVDGCLPFCVVATVGTTDYGSIDPVPELAAVCRRYGAWLHGDAAYGGGAVLSRRYAGRVAGLNQCDSLTVDFHKMFLQPISCGAILVRDKSDLKALELHADYLNREEDESDGYANLVDKSLQTTRRFDALKVWMSFQTRGRDGWDELISGVMDNAAYLYSLLRGDGDFVCGGEPELTSVVFRLAAADGATSDELNRAVRRRLLHRYGTVIGQTVSDGRVCLKCTLLNPAVSHRSLEELIELIRSLGREIARN